MIPDEVCGSREFKVRAVGATEAIGREDFSEGAMRALVTRFVPWTSCPCLLLFASKDA